MTCYMVNNNNMAGTNANMVSTANSQSEQKAILLLMHDDD